MDASEMTDAQFQAIRLIAWNVWRERVIVVSLEGTRPLKEGDANYDAIRSAFFAGFAAHDSLSVTRNTEAYRG